MGWTTLHIAARHNRLEVAHVLVESGADIDVTDRVINDLFLIKQTTNVYDNEHIVCVQLIKSSGIYCEPHLFHSMVSYV